MSHHCMFYVSTHTQNPDICAQGVAARPLVVIEFACTCLQTHASSTAAVVVVVADLATAAAGGGAAAGTQGQHPKHAAEAAGPIAHSGTAGRQQPNTLGCWLHAADKGM